MNKILILYVIGFFIMGGYFETAYPCWVFLVSLLVALIPLATSRFWFALPIVLLIYFFWFSTDPVYDSDFAWLCIIYVPFHYMSFMANIIGAIKSAVGD
jgi:hypothetical protein